MPARLILLGVALGACAAPPGARYLRDARFRRSSLEASLTARDNGYARLRLLHYGRDWERLPELNPRVEPVEARELGDASAVARDTTLGDGARALDLEAARGSGAADLDALRRLGALAFFRYPTQLAGYAARALASRADAERYGLWISERGVGGLVHVELPGGGSALALTCASCHVRALDDRGGLAVGAGSDRLDLGRLLYDDAVEREGAGGAEERWLKWGPGRADVSSLAADLPVRIPDLRPIKLVTHLQYDATVTQRDLSSLAIRIETLLITGHGGALRPPREVALGLAVYLWSLASELPAHKPSTAGEQRGRARFGERCAGCHVPPSYSGPPVALDTVGTDPAVGRSAERGTGCYRAPSLRGVSTRGALLHDGSVASLEALLDPRRTVPGHRFGLDLDATARAELLSFLRLL